MEAADGLYVLVIHNGVDTEKPWRILKNLESAEILVLEPALLTRMLHLARRYERKTEDATAGWHRFNWYALPLARFREHPWQFFVQDVESLERKE